MRFWLQSGPVVLGLGILMLAFVLGPTAWAQRSPFSFDWSHDTGLKIGAFAETNENINGGSRLEFLFIVLL